MATEASDAHDQRVRTEQFDEVDQCAERRAKSQRRRAEGKNSKIGEKISSHPIGPKKEFGKTPSSAIDMR